MIKLAPKEVSVAFTGAMSDQLVPSEICLRTPLNRAIVWALPEMSSLMVISVPKHGKFITAKSASVRLILSVLSDMNLYKIMMHL